MTVDPFPIKQKQPEGGIVRIPVKNPKELTNAQVNKSRIHFWKKPDMDFIIVYLYDARERIGSGKIGVVPPQYFDHFAPTLDQGGKIKGVIRKISGNFCDVDFELISKVKLEEEKKALDNQYREKLINDLDKEYKGSKILRTKFRTEEVSKLRKGNKLKLDIKDKKYYYDKDSIIIDVYKDKGEYLGSLQHAINKQILMAFYNGYKLNVSVEKKEALWIDVVIELTK